MLQFPPKNILVAYDFSDASRTAWRHAAALAARCGAVLEAVHVEPREMDEDSPSGLTAAHVRTLRSRIHAAIGAGFKITILQGDPAVRLLNLARLHRWDLIVVGTHARKGLKRILLGSVAEAVVCGSPVPVLVARGPVRPIRSILAPVKFTDYAEHGFAYAAAAAAAMSARLTALHVIEDPIWSGDPRPRLFELFARLPPPRPKIAEASGDVVREILKSESGHDWIVLVAHGRSLIKDAFFGTTLEGVLRSTDLPVLAVPAAHRASLDNPRVLREGVL